MKTHNKVILFALLSCLLSILSESVWAITVIEVTKLLASDGTLSDQFGFSVSVDGDTAVISALPVMNVFGIPHGSDVVYVFTRSGPTWIEQTKLTASDGEIGDGFGTSVSVSGDTAVIGAVFDDDNDSDSGSAYVFTRSDGVWTEQPKLTASDGAFSNIFGFSVSVSGDTTVIGAPGDDDNGRDSGSAYIFTRSGAAWVEQAKLTASDGVVVHGFGGSVSISGDTVVISASGDNENGSNSGLAYVFTRSGAMWAEQAKLNALDGAGNDRFGSSVSISGDTVVIGAFGDDDNGSDSGSAYVYTRSGTVWTEQAKLTASDGNINDQFGRSVSVSGDIVLISAHRDDDNGSDSGSAYVFTRSDTVWTQQDKLTASDGVGSEQFGRSVSISDSTIAIGAVFGRATRSAYVFSLIPSSHAVPMGIPIFSPWVLMGLAGLLTWLGGRKLCQ